MACPSARSARAIRPAATASRAPTAVPRWGRRTAIAIAPSATPRPACWPSASACPRSAGSSVSNRAWGARHGSRRRPTRCSRPRRGGACATRWSSPPSWPTAWRPSRSWRSVAPRSGAGTAARRSRWCRRPTPATASPRRWWRSPPRARPGSPTRVPNVACTLRPAPPDMARVAIVGAGIGGLAAAHHLTRMAAERGLPLEVVVLEASDRPGGWLATERCEGALLEHGPDTLVTHKPAGLALCERLGLGDRLVFKPAGRIDILDNGRLLPLPTGFALAAPTRARPLLASPLLSWHGKLRALAEPWVRPPFSGCADESVACFVRRRFGEELYRRISEPVVGGLFMADNESLSLAAPFPRVGGG